MSTWIWKNHDFSFGFESENSPKHGFDVAGTGHVLIYGKCSGLTDSPVRIKTIAWSNQKLVTNCAWSHRIWMIKTDFGTVFQAESVFDAPGARSWAKLGRKRQAPLWELVVLIRPRGLKSSSFYRGPTF